MRRNPNNYDLTPAEYKRLKQALKQAVASKDNDRIIRTAESALARFEAVGFPDDWSNWERAKEDAQLSKRLGRSVWNNPKKTGCNPACSMCGGELVKLGGLGNMIYTKCRDCGAQHSRLARVRRKKVKRNPRKRVTRKLARAALIVGGSSKRGRALRAKLRRHLGRKFSKGKKFGWVRRAALLPFKRKKR